MQQPISERREAVNLLYSNSGIGLFISFFAASVLVASFPSTDTLHYFKVAWWLIICATALLRLIDLLFYFTRTLRKDNFTIGRAFTRFCIGATVTSSLWSIYAVIIITQPSTSWAELAITSIIIAAFSGGSVSLLSAARRLSILYTSILTLPLSIALLMTDIEYYTTLGLLSLAFFIVMVLGASRTGRFTAKAIHFKHQNEHLLTHMEQEVAKRTKEIHSLSNIDPLTGLHNRKAFVNKLSYRLSTQPNTQLAILFIDLDGFKAINDSLGHKAGDIVIKEASQRINNLTPSVALLCRWGGDEFLLAVEQSDGLLDYAQSYIDAISKPYLIDGSKLNLGATIGVAYYPQHGKDHERLIQRADMAMYHQKRDQKGKVGIFDESLREHLLRELKLRDHLQNAIHRHELYLVYQPIIDTQTGQMTAVEALLRWQLDDELVPPDEFITIAEQYGLIRSIGIWVLGEACLAGKRLQRLYPNLGICINVSIQQLLDDDFPNEVAATLKRADFAPNNLDLEITESLFAHDKRKLIDNIARLKKLGVKVSIDDFGTGYSSLSVMQEFNVDFVKIDRSFVWSMETGGEAIVKAVSQIATAFGYRVVAEGVETEEQRQRLAQMNINFLQGYLFSRPVRENELPEIIAPTQQ